MIVSHDLDWRLVLFFSVDLTDSSRISDNSRKSNDDTSWCQLYSHFYELFPRELSSAYEEIQSFKEKSNNKGLYNTFFQLGNRFKLWKLIGDEMVFSVQLVDKTDVLFHALVAIIAQKKYKAKLREFDKCRGFGDPSCKGGLWLAGFPVNNVKISFHASEDERDTKIPDDDYIGPSMNCGFRLTKLSTERKTVISVELAHLLSSVIDSSHLIDDSHEKMVLYYEGHVDLKGILSGKSYPVFWIDTTCSKVNDDVLRSIKPVRNTETVSYLSSYFEASSHITEPFIVKNGDTSVVPDKIMERFNKIKIGNRSGYYFNTIKDNKKDIGDIDAPCMVSKQFEKKKKRRPRRKK
ncbi:MAG: hypothetical protein ABIH86_00790 [Planctomycetota bacterium]